MIRLLEWEPEIVHGEHIFEELGFLEVPYSTSLTSRVKGVSQSIRANVEVVIVFGLVDPHSPKDDRRMIPIPPDHTTHIIDRDLLPGLRPNVLPSRYLLQHQQANLIAAVEKVPRLRIVRCSDDIAVEVLT